MSWANSSYITHEIYHTEDYWVGIDPMHGKVYMKKTLMSNKHPDYYDEILIAECSLAEFLKNKDLQNMVKSWIGEDRLNEVIAEVTEMLPRFS